MTILVCPAGAVRIEGGSGVRALLGGRPVLTPGSRPGVCGCGRCRGGDGGGGALEGRDPSLGMRAPTVGSPAAGGLRERARGGGRPVRGPAGPGEVALLN